MRGDEGLANGDEEDRTSPRLLKSGGGRQNGDEEKEAFGPSFCCNRVKVILLKSSDERQMGRRGWGGSKTSSYQ